MTPAAGGEISPAAADPLQVATQTLRERYVELFGGPAASVNRAWLTRRVGWRLKAFAEGD